MSAASDGSIIFRTELDNAKLERELAKATKKIESMEAGLSEKKAARLPLAEQLKVANEEATNARNSVERLQKALAESQTITSVTGPRIGPLRYIEELEHQKQIEAELKEQEKILRQKEKVADRLALKDAAAAAKLEEMTTSLERQKEKAAALQDQLAEIERPGAVGEILDGVEKRFDKLGRRISGLAKRVFVFTMISAALRGMRTWLGKVIAANDQASNSMARLKAALLTLAQPLLDIVIPALTAFVNVLTRIITALSGLMSALFGKTIDQSKAAASALNAESSALKGTGDAAKKASKSLASFDEINQLSSGEAGGASATAATQPDFSFDTSSMEADLDKLLGWIKLIGAALLTWKIPNADFKTFLGLILAINGAIELAKGAWDAWQNGVDWDNFLQMLEGAALLTGGLSLAFGKLGAGIGLIVSGITLLATGFHDALESGWNLKNLLMTIAGIMTTGIGIGVLTGSFIPALIAGIASVLLALTVATGHGEELLNGVRQTCQGFVDFFIGVFTGNIQRALLGIEEIFGGLQTAAGAVIDGIRDTIISFLDWLDEKTGGKLHGIIEFAKGLVTAFFDSVNSTVRGAISAVQQVFRGLVEFIAGVFTNDWDMAWQGIKDVFEGYIKGIASLIIGAINLIIRGLNWVIQQANKLSFDAPDWLGGKHFGINIDPIDEWTVPRLAQGAVIPPNREFMAVLGDQKSGTNIEAPLETIKQALAEVMGSRAGTGELTIIIKPSPGLTRYLSYELDNESKRRGVNLVKGG